MKSRKDEYSYFKANKSIFDPILLLLLSRGGGAKPIEISTTEIGEILNMSQQNASVKIRELSRRGFIKIIIGNEKRRHRGIILTKKTIEQMREIAEWILKKTDEERKLKGKIFTGLGEGKYYLGLPNYKNEIKKRLNFDVFPGTLNIRLDADNIGRKQEIIKKKSAIVINGFKTKERKYGNLKVYKCKINGINGAIVIPNRTHYGEDVLEIISRYNLRKKLKKTDEEIVEVEVFD